MYGIITGSPGDDLPFCGQVVVDSHGQRHVASPQMTLRLDRLAVHEKALVRHSELKMNKQARSYSRATSPWYLPGNTAESATNVYPMLELWKDIRT